MRAIIVVGKSNNNDEKLGIADRFKNAAIELEERLICEFGFLENDCLVVLEGRRFEVYEQLEMFFLDGRNDDILLCYTGHGLKDGWALSGNEDEEALKYEDLKLLLALHCGNLIFINHCCYAMAAEEAVSARFGDYFLIGATPADRAEAPRFSLREIAYYWFWRKPLKKWNIIGLEELWIGNKNLNALMRPVKPKLLPWFRGTE